MTPQKEDVLKALRSGLDTVPLMAGKYDWNAVATRRVVENLIGTGQVVRTGQRRNPKGGTPHAVYALGRERPLVKGSWYCDMPEELYGFVHRHARLPNKISRKLYCDSERREQPYGVLDNEWHGECLGRVQLLKTDIAYVGHPLLVDAL